MSKIKVAVAGCLGRMGQEITKKILSNNKLTFVGGFEHADHFNLNKQLNKITDIDSSFVVTSNADQIIKKADVVIDFTTPASTLINVKKASLNKTAMVIGTTGITESQKSKIKTYSKKIPILLSSNMSVGVNLLFSLVEQTAEALQQTEYDIEISETHHRHKVDAPSGTALTLGEFAAKGRGVNFSQKKAVDRITKSGKLENKRTQGQIGFSVVRGGEIAGEHTISFIGENDRVDLFHKANNRSIFVKGAIEAAIFVAKKKKGLFSMADLVK